MTLANSESIQSQAFPPEIAAENLEIIESLAASAVFNSWRDPIDVLFEGGKLLLPSRLYYSVEQVDAAIGGSGDGVLVAACLGSRCDDGFLRQRSIEALLREPRPWSVPYLVEAVGEHVLEILQALDGQIPEELRPHLADYLVANESRFLYRCRQCVSYWNQFDRYRYDGLYPDWNDYPGARIIATLAEAARSAEPSFGLGLRSILPNRQALSWRRS